MLKFHNCHKGVDDKIVKRNCSVKVIKSLQNNISYSLISFYILTLFPANPMGILIANLIAPYIVNKQADIPTLVSPSSVWDVLQKRTLFVRLGLIRVWPLSY